MAGQFDEQTIRQYLLGQLGDAIRAELEQSLLTNDQSFAELLVSEDELIDEYLGGQLTEDERQRFEQHFLVSPARRENVRFAHAFNRYLKSVPAPLQPAKKTILQFLANFWNSQSRLLQAEVAAAVVALIVVAIWLYIPHTPVPQTFVSLTLSASASNNRADGVQPGKVTLPLNAEALRISLRLPDQAVAGVRYAAVLDNLDNAQAESRSFHLAKQEEQSVTIVIPAAELARGRYALKLLAIKSDSGEQPVTGAYYFDVQ